MDIDVGQYIALIAVMAGTVVLGLSYIAAYMVGRAHGRRDERRSTETMGLMDADQRLAAMESTVHGINSSVQRLMDAQRLLVAQQDHLSRKVGLVGRNDLPLSAVQPRNTPTPS